MKNFKVHLIWMAVSLVLIISAFSLGQLASMAVNRDFQIETASLQMKVSFNPEVGDLEKDIGIASVRFYADVLTSCLNEPENLEKITSTEVLTDFIAGSCLVNAVRPRIENKEKNQGEKESGPKRNL